MSDVNVIVIGAGISGLLAAHRLRSFGLSVLVLEKANGVGGRMATRRIDGARFDHGAQSFTVRSPGFLERVEPWIEGGIASAWSRGFPVEKISDPFRSEPHYCGIQGMTTIAKTLAQLSKVRLGCRVAEVMERQSGWTIVTETGETFFSDGLVVSAPLPQTLSLLKKVSDRGRPDIWDELSSITYAPCFALMGFGDPKIRLEDPGALYLKSPVVKWLADNHLKGISAVPASYTALATHAYSQKAFDRPFEEVAKEMIEAITPWVGTKLKRWQLKRWTYALPEKFWPEPFVLVDCKLPLVLVGDTFGGGRVEGAALSGWKGGHALASAIRSSRMEENRSRLALLRP